MAILSPSPSSIVYKILWEPQGLIIELKVSMFTSCPRPMSAPFGTSLEIRMYYNWRKILIVVYTNFIIPG